ncbi:MAG TPA: CinA family protein [Anaerolineaceae bacterium]
MAELLEEQVGKLLRQKQMKLTLAESCTGGLVGHRITNIPGSSDYYMGSITAYAYEAKERLLGVSHETLIQFGAVSRETALEMAHGVRLALSTDFPLDHSVGVSITGIAGPGGGMPNKPVGLVWFGLSEPQGDHAWHFFWQGDRLQVKMQSADKALELLLAYLQGNLPADI